MIEAIDLKKLRNPEYLQFMADALGHVQNNNPATLQIEPQYEALRAKYAESDELFKLPLANERTKGLSTLDGKRDKALTGISLVVTGYLNHFDPAYATAADRLNRNIKLYGEQIYRQSYQAQSATLTSMINDWDTNSDLADAIDLLGLKEWKDNMARNNNDFIDLYNQRTQDYGNEPTYNLLSKRAETNTAYYALIAMLEARKLIANNSSYDRVFGELNASINQYNTLLNNRSGRNNDNEEE